MVHVEGLGFCREEATVGGHYSDPAHALIPSYFLSAVGCDGEFTKDGDYAPLQLSKADYRKWTHNVGEHAIIIGGRNRSSIILNVPEKVAQKAAQLLDSESESRPDVHEYLQSEGYETGSAGSSPALMTHKSQPSFARSDGGETEAERLQKRVEREGYNTLSRIERRNVANRLLRTQGWDGAWAWFEEQYGDDFDPQITWRQLKSIAESFPDLNITVPGRPP